MDKFMKAKKFKQLSPAKKFRLKIRLAKFRKLQQAKLEYFEHDNRGAFASNPATQAQRSNKKKQRQAQMLVTAYLNRTTTMSQNGDVEARNGTQESSSNLVKSVISCSSPLRNSLSFVGKEQATHNKIARNLSHSLSSPTTTTITSANNNMLPNVVKCCCHCACLTAHKPTKQSKQQRKPRRKLSSPYFGEIDQIDAAGIQLSTAAASLRNPNSNLRSTASASTFVSSDALKSPSEVFRIRKNSNLMKFNHIFENNFGSALQERMFGDVDDDCNVRQVRSVVRLVVMDRKSVVALSHSE